MPGLLLLVACISWWLHSWGFTFLCQIRVLALPSWAMQWDHRELSSPSFLARPGSFQQVASCPCSAVLCSILLPAPDRLLPKAGPTSLPMGGEHLPAKGCRTLPAHTTEKFSTASAPGSGLDLALPGPEPPAGFLSPQQCPSVSQQINSLPGSPRSPQTHQGDWNLLN